MNTTIRRMSIREFRGAIRSNMRLPVIVTSDGADVFAVVSFDMLKRVMNRPVEILCPHCKAKARPERVKGGNGTSAG